jgi:hypothetical protein
MLADLNSMFLHWLVMWYVVEAFLVQEDDFLEKDDTQAPCYETLWQSTCTSYYEECLLSCDSIV